MKTIITTSLLLISSLTLFAQNYNTTLGIKIYPGISTVYNPIIKSINYSRISFSGGIEIRQRLFKDLIFIETGVYVFDRGFKVNNTYTNINGVEVESNSREIENYLTVPLSVVFKFKNFYLGGGGNLNYYLNRKFQVNGELISTDKSYQTEDILYGVQLFTGYEFKIRKDIFATIEGFASPTFNAKFINYGLGIGLKYAFTNKKIEK